VTDLLAAAAAVQGVVRAHADEAERIRRLPATTVAALTEAGLMRMCVPAAYGGPEADPMTLIAAIEAVSRGDGAAGWCTMIASTTSSMALFLPETAAKELFSDPTSVAGGAFAPTGTGRVDGDRVKVSGRWQWGSGTQHCRWIVGGARCDDDTFRLCFFDAADVTFHDTWYSSGLRGTGSLDFSVEDAVVALGRTIQPGVTPPSIDVPLAGFPNFALLAAGVAAVSLGIGRLALDEIFELARGKRPAFSPRTLAESGYTQAEVARAEAQLRAARAFLFDEVGRAWDVACAGGRIDLTTRVGIRLACVHAASAAVAATDTAYTLAGGSSVYDSNVLQRCLRDVHVTTQHLMVAPKLHETLGKLLFGLDADVTFL
jgi:alkylation response protein AidB-like acyl-CoA dehydrogenase